MAKVITADAKGIDPLEGIIKDGVMRLMALDNALRTIEKNPLKDKKYYKAYRSEIDRVKECLLSELSKVCEFNNG